MYVQTVFFQWSIGCSSVVFYSSCCVPGTNWENFAQKQGHSSLTGAWSAGSKCMVHINTGSSKSYISHCPHLHPIKQLITFTSQLPEKSLGAFSPSVSTKWVALRFSLLILIIAIGKSWWEWLQGSILPFCLILLLWSVQALSQAKASTAGAHYAQIIISSAYSSHLTVLCSFEVLRSEVNWVRSRPELRIVQIYTIACSLISLWSDRVSCWNANLFFSRTATRCQAMISQVEASMTQMTEAHAQLVSRLKNVSRIYLRPLLWEILGEKTFLVPGDQ